MANFTKGFTFDGATGAKTGSDLEQLVEDASFAVGSAALDQTTLDDDGAGAARIKALGVGTAQVAANAITDAKIRQGAARSVIGVTGASTANVADIVAGTDGHVLRRSGTTLEFGQLAAGAFPNEIISAAMIKSDALSLTATPAGGGATGLTEEGPHTTNSGSYGPFSGGVGVFAGFVTSSTATQVEVDIQYADDTGFTTNVVVYARIQFKPDAAETVTIPWHAEIPKGKYARVVITSGTVSYYLRYGVKEF